MLAEKRRSARAKIVHFHEGNSGGVVYAAYYRGVVARWQSSNYRRLLAALGSVAAVLNITDLVARDNPAGDRSAASYR